MLGDVTTGTFGSTLSPPRTGGGRVARHPVPAPRPVIALAAVVAAGCGLVAVLALGILAEARGDLHQPGGVLTLAGGLTGLVGMYLALVMVLIVARLPPLERIVGQDGMLRWHRRLGPWPISLLVAHAVLITLGFAQTARTGPGRELWSFLRSYPDMLAATVGLALMVMAGVVSIRAIRDRLRRETWWAVHLYMYLALSLSFAHVIVLGPSFVGHPAARVLWSAVWAATAGTVLVYRLGLPLYRTLRHRLRVAEVHREGPDVVSVVLQGRHLERLAVSGGQFFAWRFLTRGLWWQAHPYSLSALPRPPYLRLTVREIGDHSRALSGLRPGTRVAVEGPYGAVTADARRHIRVLLVAGGIGITAIRSLLEDLPREARPILVRRVRAEADLVLREEVAELVRHRKGTLHELVGGRTDVGDLKRILRSCAPDLHRRDLFVCGPPYFVQEVVAAARSLGVRRTSIHYEEFRW